MRLHRSSPRRLLWEDTYVSQLTKAQMSMWSVGSSPVGFLLGHLLGICIEAGPTGAEAGVAQ